jgi:hypothetical protein
VQAARPELNRPWAYGETVRASGDEVELLVDEDQPGGWLLLLDRVRQSYVCLDDPTYLEFPYAQALADMVSALPAGPLEAIHIGGGGATLPRWLAATRPGSIQLVFETHAELLRIVRNRLPFDPSAQIDIRLGDGRAGLAVLPSDSADLVVVDAFSGGRVPANLTTAEFIADVARVLRETGLLLINATAGSSSEYLRRLVAAVASQLPEILVLGGQGAVVGNVVIAAARVDGMPADLIVPDDGPFSRPLALSGRTLSVFIEGVQPLTDASSMRSPIPPDATWRVGTGLPGDTDLG